MQHLSHKNRPKTALASLVMAGSIAVIPFLLPHYGLATAFYSEWAAFALGIAACFPFLSKTLWSRLEIPRSAIWLFAVIALIAIQALFVKQAYVAQALLPGLYIAWAAVLVILGYWIREQLGVERAIAVLAWMLLAGGAVHALVGLVQYFDVSGELATVIDRKSTSVYGNIAQRNHFATQIMLASFSLIYLRATDRINRTLAIVLLALFALVLTASSSRAAAGYIIAIFFLTLISYSAARTPIHRRLLQGAGLLLVLFLLFQYLLPLLNDWLRLLLEAMGFDVNGLNTFVMLQRGAADGVELRVSEWRKAWLMFLDSPLWGIGMGNYGWYSFNYQSLPQFVDSPKEGLFHHAHNLVMQVLAELGVIGLLLLTFMAVAWLRHVLPLWRNASHWLMLALAVVLLLHSAVEYPLWYSYFLGIAAILLGLGSKEALKIEFTPGLGRFMTAAVLIFSGAILLITFIGVQDLNRVPRIAVTVSPQHASATIHAVSKNPLLTPWAEVAFVLYGVPDKNIIDQQLLLTTRVIQYRPNSHNVNRHIVYLALAGRMADASALMKKAFIAYPSDFPGYACSWKFAPAKEARLLWAEAEKMSGDGIKCGTEDETATSPS